MLHEEIINIAREAGFPCIGDRPILASGEEAMRRFATLVAAAEREALQRKPLTDEQLRDALRDCPRDTVENLRVRWLYAKDFARAIEAAHGIKE